MVDFVHIVTGKPYPDPLPQKPYALVGSKDTRIVTASLGDQDYEDVLTAFMYERGYILAGEAMKGGPGSGNFGHSGRPGKIGGSAPVSAVSDMSRGNRSTKFSSVHYWGDTQVPQAKEISEGLNKNMRFFRWNRARNSPKLAEEDTRTGIAIQSVFDKIQETTGMDLLKQYPFYQIKVARSNRDFNAAYRRALADAGADSSQYDVNEAISACTPDGLLLRPVMSDQDGQPFIKMNGKSFPAYPVYLHEISHAFGYKSYSHDQFGTRDIVDAWESTYYNDFNFDRETEYAKSSHLEGFSESFSIYVIKGGRNAPKKYHSQNPYKPTPDDFWDSLIDHVNKEGFE